MYTPDKFGTKEFLNLLRKRSITVYEDVQGSKIWVRWNGVMWEIRPKSPTNPPLNMVDMAVQKFYNKAYLYLLTLPFETTEFLNTNWHLCFEYFCDEQPANIRYSTKPDSNLVLTCIYKGKDKYSYDTTELKSYAALLGTDVVPVVYRGKLSEQQILNISRFLHTSPYDLQMLFDETNFAKFFYKILSPASVGSYLMRDEWQNNLEKFIIRFDDDSELSFQLLNPLYNKTGGHVETEFEDVYSVILITFLQYMQTVDLAAVQLDEKTGDSMYLELICKLYNTFMQQTSKSLLRLGFTVPHFFTKDKFKINRDFIKDATTLDWIDKNPKYEYVLKIVLTALQRPKKKTFGIFTERTIEVFNHLVVDIQNRIHRQLQVNKGQGYYKDKALTYGEFSDLKDLTDGDGKPHLDWEPDGDQLFGQDKKKPFVVKKKL